MSKNFPKTVQMEIFKGGSQTDSKGSTNEWTEAKLDKIVEGYNSRGADVPAVVSKVGHPVDNQPAFGWFSEFKRKGNSIFATLGNINENFADMLRNKTFKNRSIALRRNLSPRHVCFLGATPPAIAGLEDYNFNEKDEDEYSEFEFEMGENEFADHATVRGFHIMGNVLQRIRDFKIEDKSVEEADKLISQFEIDMLKEMQVEHNSSHEDDPTFNENDLNNKPGDDHMKDFEKLYNEETQKTTELTNQLEAKDKESTKFSESSVSEKKRADAAEATIKKSADESEAKEFNEYAEGLVKSNKILPAEKALVVTNMKTLSGQESYDFTETDGSVTKHNQLEDYKKMLTNKAEGTLFSEKFDKGKSAAETTDDTLRLETNKIMVEKGVNFNEAGEILMTTRPELFNGATFTESEEDFHDKNK